MGRRQAFEVTDLCGVAAFEGEAWGKITVERAVGAPEQFVGVALCEVEKDLGWIGKLAFQSPFRGCDDREILGCGRAVDSVGGNVEPSVGERGDLVEVVSIKATGVGQAETQVGIGSGDLEDGGGWRPGVVGGDTGMNEKWQVVLGGEIEQGPAPVEEVFDVGAECGGLDF